MGRYLGSYRVSVGDGANHYRAVLMNYTKDLSEDWAEMIKDTAERCLLYTVLVILAVVGGFVLALHWGWFR